MTYSLEHYLDLVPDHRRKQGQRYPKLALLMMMVLANMSGCYGYREIAGYMAANEDDFIRLYKLKHGVPKHVGLRTFILELNFEELLKAFRLWSSQFLGDTKGEVYSIDGKSMNSTVENCHNSQQSYKSMVSLFNQQTGTVVDTEMIEIKKTHEIGAAQLMIERLEAKGIIITADALHCQKKL